MVKYGDDAFVMSRKPNTPPEKMNLPVGALPAAASVCTEVTTPGTAYA